MIDVGFIRAQHAGIMVQAEEIGALVDKLAAYEPHRTIFQMKADDL